MLCDALGSSFRSKGSGLAFHRLTKAPPLSRSTVEVHLEVNDVDKVYSSLKSKGVKFDGPPANRPWGTRSAGFKDPEGFVVEIVGPLKPGEPSKGN
ncbi:hypothetical protein E6H28_05190 [Candidatus Bathyarchaeota archaeon]|nr:MAG: hypothetical protein E6H28_05190 [Candidatus Bathyarchaeota archaeon]